VCPVAAQFTSCCWDSSVSKRGPAKYAWASVAGVAVRDRGLFWRIPDGCRLPGYPVRLLPTGPLRRSSRHPPRLGKNNRVKSVPHVLQMVCRLPPYSLAGLLPSAVALQQAATSLTRICCVS